MVPSYYGCPESLHYACALPLNSGILFASEAMDSLLMSPV